MHAGDLCRFGDLVLANQLLIGGGERMVSAEID